MSFWCVHVSRFTYEIAPVFVLMEQLTLKKMREIVGWPSGEGDGIFSPGLCTSSDPPPKKKSWPNGSKMSHPVPILSITLSDNIRGNNCIEFRNAFRNNPTVILQGAPSQTCTASWLPDTSSFPRSRPKAWLLPPGWSSLPQSMLVSLYITQRNCRFLARVHLKPTVTKLLLLFGQSHYSIKKASAALGFGTENLILLNTDDRFFYLIWSSSIFPAEKLVLNWVDLSPSAAVFQRESRPRWPGSQSNTGQAKGDLQNLQYNRNVSEVGRLGCQLMTKGLAVQILGKTVFPMGLGTALQSTSSTLWMCVF